MSDAPTIDVIKEFKVIEIEFCNYSCKEFIEDVVDMSPGVMELHLDIFLFQILYTLLATKKKFPCFMHNDLFMRNILGIKENNTGRYYTYIYMNNTYRVPQKRFFPKINDFGMTNLTKDI